MEIDTKKEESFKSKIIATSADVQTGTRENSLRKDAVSKINGIPTLLYIHPLLTGL
jgi:hypothetical protein